MTTYKILATSCKNQQTGSLALTCWSADKYQCKDTGT